MIRTHKNIKIIFEGHYFTMKSSLVKHLSSKYNLPYLSGEWNIFNDYSVDYHTPNLIVPKSIAQARVQKSYALIIDLFNLFLNQPFLVDRFHLSLQFYDKLFNTNYYFSEIEDKLIEMNTIVVFCRNNIKDYDNVLIERLCNNQQKENIYPLTKAAYRREELIFAEIVKKSKLPIIECNVEDKTIEQIENEIKGKLTSLKFI
mgnify:CR=1 FL=1